MDEKINLIKTWLGTGSINIFGMPFSGKDTVGMRLAQDLNGRFLSSGLILRAAEENDKDLFHEMSQGMLASTDKFRDIVLPYFHRSDLRDFPLILSSVGRWEGEEYDVIKNADESHHPIKAVILLNISEAEIRNRWEAAQNLQDRGDRSDDKIRSVLDKRVAEFIEKTMPVIQTYQKREILLPINAHADRETVYTNVIEALAKFADEHTLKREIKLQ